MAVSDVFSLNICVSVFVSIITFSYLYAKYKLSYWQRRGVKTLPTNTIFGNFKDVFFQRYSVGKNLGRLHLEAEKYEKNMPCLGIYVMHKPFLLLRSPEIIKQVLIKDFHVFSNRYFATNKKYDVVGSTNLFSVKNPRWKFMRTKLSPAFSSGKQKKLFHLMKASAENMTKYLGGLYGNGNNVVTIDAKETSTKYTTDVIASLSFGIETNSFEIPVQDFYKNSRRVFKVSALRFLQFFLVFFFPTLSDYFGTSFLGKYTTYFRNIFWNSMNNREKMDFKRGDAIDYLLELKNDKQSKDYGIEGDVLLAQSSIFLVAGLETSAMTISLALHEIAKNPLVQKKLRAEIIDNMQENQKEITYEALAGMKYLQQIVLETMRHYPPAPIIDRVAETDYQLPGTDIIIEKGTAVQIALDGLHMDPRFHQEPEKFDPDRFSDEKKEEMTQCSYMPFGDGPRACIGSRLGVLQTSVGILTILRDYEVALNPKYKNKLSPRAIFIQPVDGIKLDFKKL